MSSLEVPVPVPLALLLITAGEDFLACLQSTCTCKHRHTHTHTHIHTHSHTHTRTHARMHAHTHTHTHIHCITSSNHFPFYTSCLSHQFEKLTNPPIHYLLAGPNLNTPFKEKVNSLLPFAIKQIHQLLKAS